MDFKPGDIVKAHRDCRYITPRGKTGKILEIKIPPEGMAQPDENVLVDFGLEHCWYIAPRELDFISRLENEKNVELKDTGDRRSFTTGAVRDRGGMKPALVLIPAWSEFAYGWILEAGAKKYAARNWEKGMPMSEYINSAERHIKKYKAGWRDEPHLWQAFWNIGCAIHTQIMIYIGVYPAEFYDLPNHVGKDPAPILSEFEKVRVDGMMEESKK